MKIIVRKYQDSDWSALVEMTTSIVDLMSHIDPHKRFRPKEQFDVEHYARLSMQNAEKEGGYVFIAEADGEVAGYGIGFVEKQEERDAVNKFPAKQGYIDAFFVKEKFREKGVATKLMDTLEEYFRSIDCERSSVACVATNHAARSFYENAGYGEQYIHFLKKL